MGTSKSKGIFHNAMPTESYKPISTMRLEGAHAKGLASHPVGKKVTFKITGTKMEHAVGNAGEHSARYNLHNVQPIDSSGPKNKAANNDADDQA